jgi:hypothetical protein
MAFPLYTNNIKPGITRYVAENIHPTRYPETGLEEARKRDSSSRVLLRDNNSSGAGSRHPITDGATHLVKEQVLTAILEQPTTELVN